MAKLWRSNCGSRPRQGLELRLKQLFPDGHRSVEKNQQYRERLEEELDLLCQMGFAGYFLVVADFIKYSRKRHIPVGPGRGSAAGSLVAYALEITDLGPHCLWTVIRAFSEPGTQEHA